MILSITGGSFPIDKNESSVKRIYSLCNKKNKRNFVKSVSIFERKKKQMAIQKIL